MYYSSYDYIRMAKDDTESLSKLKELLIKDSEALRKKEYRTWDQIATVSKVINGRNTNRSMINLKKALVAEIDRLMDKPQKEISWGRVQELQNKLRDIEEYEYWEKRFSQNNCIFMIRKRI